MVWLTRNFDNATDGFVYGTAVGVGFAVTENYLYATGIGINNQTGGSGLLVLIAGRTLFRFSPHMSVSRTPWDRPEETFELLLNAREEAGGRTRSTKPFRMSHQRGRLSSTTRGSQRNSAR